MNDYLYRPAYDKLLHFFYGAMVGVVVVLFVSPVYALMAVALVAALKEAIDYISKKGTVDIFDIVWTVVGGAVAIF